MAKQSYWLSFMIHKDQGYQTRYERLETAIQSLAGQPGMWWKDTTSFVTFSTASNMDAVAAAVKQAINPATDIALIAMWDFKTARIIGAFKDQDIFKLVPFVKKA